MNQLGEKLASAMSAKENSVKNYIWKGAKRVVGGNLVQDEIHLVDASDEELKKFYSHCQSMLYNTDKTNPGRYTLLDIIKEQRLKCHTELFLRWLENAYLPSTTRRKMPRFSYLQAIREALDAKKVTQDQWKEILITSFTGGIPEEFQDLTIDFIIDGCLGTLGMFVKQHITLTFITKLGLWFDNDELTEFSERAKAEGKNKIDLVKEICNLRPTTNIRVDPHAVLNFKQFRAMVNLKNKKYSDMTTDQLLTLRNKVLFKLEDEVKFHIKQWEEKIAQIKEVAESRNLVLE